MRKTLEDLQALGIENVFALTGDHPKAGPGQSEPVFDLDSVQLVRLIAELRRGGMPFHVAVAVSPFKYVEADCVYQYLKLEKKIAAGADLAITQVGWDALKLQELKRHLDERGLTTPVLGNVYVLGPKAAERMATGQPPGCWVSPALLETVRRESAAKDEVVYAHNPHTPLIPASNLKLVTTAAALERLGPAFKFKTEPLKPGTYVLVLKVRDAAGNTGSGDVVFTVGARSPDRRRRTSRGAPPRARCRSASAGRG